MGGVDWLDSPDMSAVNCCASLDPILLVGSPILETGLEPIPLVSDLVLIAGLDPILKVELCGGTVTLVC